MVYFGPERVILTTTLIREGVDEYRLGGLDLPRDFRTS
jgi:hypothetical protein